MFVAVPAHLHAQPASGPVYESYRRAHALLERALAAHGGAAAIRGLRGIDYRYRGFTYDRDQGLLAAQAFDSAPPRRPVGVRAAVDYASGSQLSDFGVGAREEGSLVRRTVQRGREVVRFAPDAPEGQRTFVRDSLPPGAPASFPFQHQLMPPLVLRQAIVRSLTLRHIGQRSHSTFTEELVSFINADGSVLAIGIDQRSGLVSTVETIGEIGLFGDGDHVWRFTDYADSGGIQVPHAFQHRINGLLQEDMRLVDVAVNPRWGDGMFDVPKGYTESRAPIGAPRTPAVVAAGKGLFFIEGLGGYRTMFVESGTGIIAVEAPLSPRVAEQALALTRASLPGKPITDVVLTHHHLDHMGGVRAYVDAGAAIVAPVGMDDYLRRVLCGVRTLGRLGSAPAEPSEARITSVATRRRLGPVELIPFTSSHATHMLVVYVPAHRLVFQADLVQMTSDDAPRASATAQELVQLIDREKLAVDSIASVHGRTISLAELRRAVGGL